MTSVKLINVYKTFDGIKYVVDGISVNVDNGAFLVIVGPSGCGKTTTLNLIAGLDNVSSGDIIINEKNVTNIEPKDRNIAMVFQSHTLYPHLTVYENLAFALKIKRVDKKLIDEKIQKIAVMLGLSGLLNRKPHQLSGGQKQRVAIGRAIIREPSVFLMDEPLSNLDATLKRSMREELKRLHKELQATFIYVTHDQMEAMSLATQLAIMHEGKIQQIGSPYEVFMNPNNLFVAKFMGAYPLNLFQCDMINNKSVLSIDFLGGTLHAYLDKSHEISAGSMKVCVCIRSEGFEVSPDRSGVQLTVLSTEVLGVDTLIKGAINNCENENTIINVLLPTQAVKQGAMDIFIRPKLDMVMLFNAVTGQRFILQENLVYDYPLDFLRNCEIV
ncbi:MAG: ABC transporter ATP-binding protein [Nitrososphaerota archaeon]|nr:ABC transporter ATP-binding protein [Nitrososphaerota archaeon]